MPALLPALFDPHVHIREPGQEYKETWETGTMAAVSSGILTIGMMPNLKEPIINEDVLNKVVEIANEKSKCDYRIFLGASRDNFKNISDIANRREEVIGLKIYMNDTFGDMKIDDIGIVEQHLINWKCEKIIVIHCEYEQMKIVLEINQKYNRKIHIAHISTVEQLFLIKKYKNITCEVTPHHLLLDSSVYVKPCIEKNKLIDHLDKIDCIATDHAPHLKEENKPGINSLEFSTAIMLDLVNKKYLTLDRMIEMMHFNPFKIFNIKKPENSYIVIDLEHEWILQTKYSKCAWSPFDGMKVKGRVMKVQYKGKCVFEL